MDGVAAHNFLSSGPYGTLKLAFQKAGILIVHIKSHVCNLFAAFLATP